MFTRLWGEVRPKLSGSFHSIRWLAVFVPVEDVAEYENSTGGVACIWSQFLT